jgi:type IX secretion system substrate protein
MKKIITLLFISSLTSLSVAQNEADKWFFGTGAGLDFSSGSPVVITSTMYTAEGTAVMSDATGKLRFYTDGVTVYDSTKTAMPNGNGMTGDISSTQSSLIVPSPVSASQYYLFTTGADGTGDLRYSIIDMTLNSGLGDVVTATKNTLLTDSITEKLAAIRDGGNGIWLVSHKWGTNQFLSYHITTSGIVAPVMSSVGSVHTTSAIQNSYGQLKFNNCGTRLACAVGYQDIVELFDFNLTTGAVSNAMNLNLSSHVYGVEFSPSGNFLYVTSYLASCKISQFNISLATLPLIAASKTPLSITDDLYGLQLGPDGKIYVARSYGTNFLGVISNPEVAGGGCNYSDTGIDLDPSFMGVNGGLSLPAFMQSYLKLATGASCVTTGINESVLETLYPVYPNPATIEFNIDLSGSGSFVAVYDHTGKLVEQHNNMNEAFTFGKTYAKGIYLINIINDNASVTHKIIKQ